MRERISLNGCWDWNILGGKKQAVIVPSSYFCVGEAIFEKKLTISRISGKRIFICFDGVCNTGKLWVNGIEIGKTLPYVPYKFDITSVVTQGDNIITMSVDDLHCDLGDMMGWENYGGLIRDVYCEITDAVYIEDYQWITDLKNNYSISNCTLNVWLHNTLNSEVEGKIKLSLTYNGNVVHSIISELVIRQGQNKIEFNFTIENPMLWSPECPNLYELEIEMSCLQDISDCVKQVVGFRDFKAVGTRFHLNGRDVFLKGVCRHDMWGDGQGHTLTKEQMEKDLLLIKETGANYIRCVHYPHHKYIIELADKIGLMISEEPGLWGNNLTDEKVKQTALEIMRRTILRDRNNCSLVFWLLSNECSAEAIDFIIRGKEMCKELDTTRLLSAANCDKPEKAKLTFSNAGLDFYTQHPYGYVPDVTHGGSLLDILTIYNDKPLVFTEWGGWLIHNNPNLVDLFDRFIEKYANNRAPELNLSGIAYWHWGDIYQFRRGGPSCIDGLLADGLVDAFRNKKPMYNMMTNIFKHIDSPIERCKIEEIGEIRGLAADKEYVPIDLATFICSEKQKKLWDFPLRELSDRCKGWEHSSINGVVGPTVPKNIDAIRGVKVKIPCGLPYIFTEDNKHLEVDIGLNVERIYFYGHVTFIDGYPTYGIVGETIARYILVYGDGTKEEIVLKNAFDFASSIMFKGVSRINPIATNVKRVLKLTIDPNFEVFQVNCFELEADISRKLEKIIFELVEPKYRPLLYGITVVKGMDI